MSLGNLTMGLSKSTFSVGILGWIAVSSPLGCRSHVAPDPRFATPEATLASLMRSHRFDRMTDEQVRRRINGADGHEDEADLRLFHACFVDYDEHRSVDTALMGWVLGALAAGRGHWRVVRVEDRADIFVGERDKITLVRDGPNWRISLRDSIPPHVRTELERIIAAAQNGRP